MGFNLLRAYLSYESGKFFYIFATFFDILRQIVFVGYSIAFIKVNVGLLAIV